MTPTPSPDPARYVSPVCRDGSHQACANFRGTCRCTCHAAAGEGTERPGGWRKKPVEVEARQVHYANRFDVAAWCGGEAPFDLPAADRITVNAAEVTCASAKVIDQIVDRLDAHGLDGGLLPVERTDGEP